MFNRNPAPLVSAVPKTTQQIVRDTPTDLDDRFAQLLESLHSIFNMYPTDAKVIVNEFTYHPNGNTITMNLNIQYPVLITAIIASIPSGTAGTLTIGSAGDRLVTGIVPGQAPLSGIALVVYPADPITLTTVGAARLVAVSVIG